MISRREIQNNSIKYGVPAATIDKDYVLDHLVSGIFENLYLQQRLVFKGGTCLKKCYFEDYRFSEDLDFTANLPIDKKKLFLNINKVLEKINAYTGIIFGKIIGDEIYYQNELMGYKFVIPFWGANHPKNKKPGSAVNWPSLKIDITLHEIIIFPINHKKLNHNYSDKLSTQNIMTYSINETISEKLRSLLQRPYSAPRDYYDLWYITKNIKNLDWNKIKEAFIKKCAFKNIEFRSVDDFFKHEELMSCKNQWHNSLGNHVKELPEFTVIIEELRKNLNSINL